MDNIRDIEKNILWEHMLKIFVPNFITEEMCLCLDYYSTSKIVLMQAWNYDQFTAWYIDNNDLSNY